MKSIIKEVTPHVKKSNEFEIKQILFNEENGRFQYNQIIRENVEDKFGIYLWINNATNEIIYIGMAGRIKTSGEYGGHTLRKRLVASRLRINGRDTQTNDYINHYMSVNNIKTLKFFVMYPRDDVPPSYLEAILLYKFYKQNRRLPALNKSF